jgi:anaerobic selenocysteine-containing dehydrogenase
MAMRCERLTTPLVREGGELRDASWDEALDRAATGFRTALDEGALTGVFSTGFPRPRRWRFGAEHLFCREGADLPAVRPERA